MYDIVLGRSKSDTKKYGKKGTVLIGKQYVQMGQTSSLSNPIYLDVARAHAMLIVGKRGGGKCGRNLDIVLSDGRVKKIEELENEKIQVCSINTKYKIEEVKSIQFYKRKVKELTKITLRSGKEIELTPEHPLLTINSWKEVRDLKKGTRIATPRIIPVEGAKSIGIYKAKILGYLIAEGSLTQAIYFTNTDSILIEDFKKSAREFSSDIYIKELPKNKAFRVSSKTNGINSNPVLNWIRELELFGCDSFTKFIPECIFTTSNKEIKEFLKVMFSCDGSIYKEKNNFWKICYSSVSKKIIEQVSHLLLRFGIISKFRKKYANYNGGKNPFYELEIKGIAVQEYIEKIGFLGKKEEKSKIALKTIQKLSRNPNLDTIPKEIWKRYKPNKSWTEIGREIEYKYPKAMRESARYSPSREKLNSIAKIDNNEEIQNLANSDIFWDEVTHIERLVGNFEVYDLSVPPYNNFIANDIIVHNSYTMGSIAEGLADIDGDVAKNLAFVLLDTMGVYWSMKYPNSKEEELLTKWGIEGKGLDVQIYVPGGFYDKYKSDGIPVDFPLYIQPRELSVEDWMNAFKLKTDDIIGVAVQRVINRMLNSKKNFTIEEVIDSTEKDTRLDEKTKLAVINRFENCLTWGIFSKNGTPIKDIFTGGKVTVLDLSPYVAMPGGWEIKALTLGIIAKKIFVERMLVRKREELYDIVNKTQVVKKDEVEEDLPMPWLIVDECHEFLPAGEEQAPSKQALMTILREGRQPGVSLIMATQQPAKIHTDAITQSDIVLAHRLTASFDLEALDKIFLSYDSKGARNLFNTMPKTKGCAIIMDDKNERLHTMQVKPRTTWHGGEDPNAIREIEDEYGFD